MDSGRRFRSTVPFYVRHRTRYPAALFAGVARSLGLDGRGRLLDLGCGPGFVALGLAPFVAEAAGMDPEPSMLEAAREEAEAAGVRLALIEGGSADLGPALGVFRVVVMGRSFHWMDRGATLRSLDRLIEPGGAVVLFGDLHPEDAPENAWKPAFREMTRRRGGGAHARWSGDWEDHEAVLARSAFAALERLTSRHRRETTIDDLIGRALSLSSLSPEALGCGRAAFERELRAALAPFAPDGRLAETIEAWALVARRPG